MEARLLRGRVLVETASYLRQTAEHASSLHRSIQSLVKQESASDDPAGIDAALDLLASWVHPLGAHMERHRHPGFGDIGELRFGPHGSARKPVLLLGHLDTVWPRGTLSTMPWQETDGQLRGPGVLDMKAGVVMALTALRVLDELNLARPVIFLLNSDEEIGSPVSRPITERLALECSAVFVLEPAQGLAYKTARKGVAQYRVEVKGVGAHSGVDFERGHSAVLEIAKLVQTISGFTDLDRKLTVNCGVIAGGTRPNIGASDAHTDVDVRIASAADADYVDELFRALRTADPQCSLSVSGGVNRPPMERSPGTVELFLQARRLAGELGFLLDEASTGGGSDGNFTAALGIPTLDGMGAVGEGAHAAHEYVTVEHLLPRTALLAAMLAAVP